MGGGELIKRLEGAKEGSRELDAAVANFVGWKCVGAYSHKFKKLVAVPPGRGATGVRIIPTFTTSLDAALTLVPENFSYELTYSAAGEGALRRTRLWDWRRGPLALDPSNNWEAQASTLPLALCIAALKARGDT